MNEYNQNDSVPFFFAPVDWTNTILPFTGYVAGNALDGSHIYVKCRLTVKNPDGTIALSARAVSINAITMFLGTDTHSAVITIAEGFNPATTTVYTYSMWYDSTDVANTAGVRKEAVGTFTVFAPAIANPVPPNNP
jgi:hypothetical protein